MADSTLNFFVASGTAAERAAHIPSPPSPSNAPPNQGVLWYDTTDNHLYAWDGAAWDDVSLGTGQDSVVVQVVNTQTGAMATGTTTVPIDDTIPQNTEGSEFMTLAITPTDAANKLQIDIEAVVGSSALATLVMALFQDATANSLAAVFQTISAADNVATLKLTHYMTAGTTSATTFKVRIGPGTAATVTFNGVAAGRIFGGVMASSITISEIIP